MPAWCRQLVDDATGRSHNERSYYRLLIYRTVQCCSLHPAAVWRWFRCQAAPNDSRSITSDHARDVQNREPWCTFSGSSFDAWHTKREERRNRQDLIEVFSERELTFTFAICYRPSVCRLSSVTFVHPTQTVEIFVNISTALDTLAIHWRPLKILRRSSQGNPSAGRVKHKRGSKI